MTERQRVMQRKRQKRRRVARIKTGLVSALTIWILISIVMIIGLTIKVSSLQKQINALSSKEEKIVAAEKKSAKAGQGDLGKTNYSGSDEKNIADNNDTLKVYLTFDDGPSSNTDKILDTLDDYGVKATFFTIGREDKTSRERYLRIFNEGHTLAMHSYTHKYNDIYSSVDAFASDLDRIQSLLYDITGTKCTFYRFPGGSSNQVSNIEMTKFIKYLNDNGVTYFDWNVSSGDATSQPYTADQLVDNVMTDVVKYKTSVVLMHDAETKTTTVKALPKLIEKLQSKGAVLLPITKDTKKIQHVTLPK